MRPHSKEHGFSEFGQIFSSVGCACDESFGRVDGQTLFGKSRVNPLSRVYFAVDGGDDLHRRCMQRQPGTWRLGRLDASRTP